MATEKKLKLKGMRSIYVFVHKSAVTGAFVSAAYAKRYPARTVKMRVRKTVWR